MSKYLFISGYGQVLDRKDAELPQLAIGFLREFLTQEGFKKGDFELWNANIEKNEAAVMKKAEAIAKSKKYKFYLFSTLTCDIPAVLEIIRIIKENHPEGILIMGGYATVDAMTIWMHSPIDIIVRGGGETVLPWILWLIERNKGTITEEVVEELSYLPGIIMRYRGKIFVSEKGSEEAPRKGFSQYPKIDYDFLMGKTVVRNRDELIYLSAVGCPFSCSYCALATIKHIHDMKPIEKVLEELKEIVRKYKPKQITFYDPTFTLVKERVIALCEGIVREGLDKQVEFGCQTRIDLVNEEIIKAMLRANFRTMQFGVESYSPHVLAEMNKHSTSNMTNQGASRTIREKMARIKPSLLMVRDARIPEYPDRKILPGANIILFTEASTPDDVYRTTSFALWCLKNSIRPSIYYFLVPDPGTYYFVKLKREGKLCPYVTGFDLKKGEIIRLQPRLVKPLVFSGGKRVDPPFYEMVAWLPNYLFSDPRTQLVYALFYFMRKEFVRKRQTIRDYPRHIIHAVKAVCLVADYARRLGKDKRSLGKLEKLVVNISKTIKV